MQSGASRAGQVVEALYQSCVWERDGESATHRIAPAPFVLSPDQTQFLHDLGHSIWAFYRALNHLYLRKGHEWVRQWLDQGKPSWLQDLGRMNYARKHLPRLLRPDLILTDNGMALTELDSVPGGAGHTAAMAGVYQQMGLPTIGGGDGIPQAFASAIEDLAGVPEWTLAIVVSDESEDYRAEMTHLAQRLQDMGHRAWCVHPKEVLFDEDGLWLDGDGARARIDVLWRFFELFDLRNIPKSELVMYASKKRKVVVSPPYKTFLEEKMALALLRHHALQDFWRSELGEHFDTLLQVVPESWVMDPAPVPLHASISRLSFRGRPVRNFMELADASQKERRMIVKPSGFSPQSWGSRGVIAGHDVSAEVWTEALQSALDEFPRVPHVLQEFREGKRVEVDYFDPANGQSGRMSGRVRLCPYYYVSRDEPVLAGVLATICSDEKKLIHGMTDAVMTVCSEGSSDSV